MFHPLLGSTANLSVQELENKIYELTKKYTFAIRSGNGDLGRQILVALESYKSDLQVRIAAANKAPTRNGDSDLDKLINVD